MSLPRLWKQIAASGLILAAAAVAGGQEASSVQQSSAASPAARTTEGPTTVQPSAATETKSKPTEKDTTPKDELGELVEQAIQITGQRKLTAGEHTPWQIVHGILAMRWDLKLRQRNSADEISGIEWITSGQYFDGMPLWEATPYGGRGHPFTRPYAFEGHPTQFMGYMTLADIPPEYEVQTPTRIVTVRDIIKDAKMQVREGVEITWTLWALSHYEEPDAQWFNAYNEPWSIERLVRVQINEPVTSGACGGCHGLFALAYARNLYISTGKPLRGVWLEADQKIKRYVAEAKALQNADGSFSSNHFRGPGYSEDFPTRITTSGHQLEWLMIALPQSKLKEEWVRRAIRNVANDLIKNRNVASDCGPLYHGMHALVVYRQRTVPGYLVPQFNSHIKLADRGKKKSAVETTKAAPKSGDLVSPPVASQARPGADEQKRPTVSPAVNSAAAAPIDVLKK